MQNHGIQTVLQMSHAVERVQAAEQSHAPLAAAHAKEAMEKQDEMRRNTVHETSEAEGGKVRDEDQYKQSHQRQTPDQKRRAAQKREEEERRMSPPVSSDPTHGSLLNIKV